MLQVFKQYYIPNEIQSRIYLFLQEKDKYNSVLKDLQKGIHRSYIRIDNVTGDYYSFDIFKKQFAKKTIVVKVSDLNKVANLSNSEKIHALNGISNSLPLFNCKLCKKYHEVIFDSGKKYCDKLYKYIE